MTDAEKRLNKLAIQIANERRKGFIQKWSEEIKSEAVFLTNVFGIKKVYDITNLHKPTLREWRKNNQSTKEQILKNNEFEKVEFSVTRIMSNSPEHIISEKAPIASIVSEKSEFRIFCKDLAMEIARFYL
jgi:hypothetical protein